MSARGRTLPAVRVAALVGALCLCAPGLAADGNLRQGLNEILSQPLEHERDAADRLERLVALGADAAPEAVRVLAGRVAGVQLDASRRELLLGALRAWPEDARTEAVLGLLGERPSLADETTVVRLLGQIAGGRGIPLVCTIVRSLDAADLAHPRIGKEVEGALAAMLRRDVLAFGYLREEVRRAEPPLLARIVVALGQTPSDESTLLLERLLGQSPELDGLVLESFGMQGPWGRRCGSGACADAVRKYLGDHDPKLRRHAAVALGRLEDTTATGDLLARLDDPDRRVRAASLWSLRRMTGLGWSGDAARWQALARSEEDWLATTFPGVADDFTHADAVRARQALHAVATHVWVRQRIVPHLSRAFEHEDLSVAIAACEALVRLGGKDAWQVLEQALEDRRPEVREAAARGLAALRTKAEDSPAS